MNINTIQDQIDFLEEIKHGCVFEYRKRGCETWIEFANPGGPGASPVFLDFNEFEVRHKSQQ